MRRIHVSLIELAFVAVTRGAGGAGVGLLAAGLLPRAARRRIGWALVGIGVLTTIPIALEVLARSGNRRAFGLRPRMR